MSSTVTAVLHHSSDRDRPKWLPSNTNTTYNYITKIVLHQRQERSPLRYDLLSERSEGGLGLRSKVSTNPRENASITISMLYVPKEKTAYDCFLKI